MAITRAERGVKLSFAQSRTKWGTHTSNSPSRFIKEIDKKYILNPLPDYEEQLRTKFDDDDDSIFGLRRKPATYYPGASKGVVGGQRQPQQRMHSPMPQRPASSPQRIAPRADFVPDSPNKVAVGNKIEHDRFGIGTVISLEGDVTNRKAVVDFEGSGRKTLLLKFAKVRVIL